MTASELAAYVGRTIYCPQHGRWIIWQGCSCAQHRRECPEYHPGPRWKTTTYTNCTLRERQP